MLITESDPDIVAFAPSIPFAARGVWEVAVVSASDIVGSASTYVFVVPSVDVILILCCAFEGSKTVEGPAAVPLIAVDIVAVD